MCSKDFSMSNKFKKSKIQELNFEGNICKTLIKQWKSCQSWGLNDYKAAEVTVICGLVEE